MSDRLGPQRTHGLIFVVAMVALMWVTEVIDAIDDHRLDSYGIHPRDVEGLPEVLAAPFLHVSFEHLISNTVPFAIMGATIALSGVARVAYVSFVVAIVSGLGTWLIAPADTIHLGASGVVFGYATYLVARGIYSRRLIEIGVGVVVVGIWGVGLLQGLLPQDHISWQAHLFGAIGGVVAASMLAAERPRPAAPAVTHATG
jgi:membrane associated rhomboid family serine protease